MERTTMVRPEASSKPRDLYKIKALGGCLQTLKNLGIEPYDWLDLLSIQGSKVMTQDLLECLSILDSLRLHEQKKLD